MYTQAGPFSLAVFLLLPHPLHSHPCLAPPRSLLAQRRPFPSRTRDRTRWHGDDSHSPEVTLSIDDRALFLQSVKARSLYMARLSTFAHNKLFASWSSQSRDQVRFGGISPTQFFACATTADRAAPCMLIGL